MIIKFDNHNCKDNKMEYVLFSLKKGHIIQPSIKNLRIVDNELYAKVMIDFYVSSVDINEFTPSKKSRELYMST